MNPKFATELIADVRIDEADQNPLAGAVERQGKTANLEEVVEDQMGPRGIHRVQISRIDDRVAVIQQVSFQTP